MTRALRTNLVIIALDTPEAGPAGTRRSSLCRSDHGRLDRAAQHRLLSYMATWMVPKRMELNPVKLFLDYHHRTSRIPQGARVTASLARHLRHVDSLLDIGCGDGANTKRVAESVGATRVVGVDVHVRERCLIPVERYNGRDLPFPDRSFAAVMLVDVLHHCDDAQRVLDEAVRVADQMVVLKDHFAFGRVTRKLLHLMDIFGNAKDKIPSPGNYFDLSEWVKMIDHAGARIAALDWPLRTHDLPWRIVGWPELQFTAKLVRL